MQGAHGTALSMCQNYRLLPWPLAGALLVSQADTEVLTMFRPPRRIRSANVAVRNRLARTRAALTSARLLDWTGDVSEQRERTGQGIWHADMVDLVSMTALCMRLSA